MWVILPIIEVGLRTLWCRTMRSWLVLSSDWHSILIKTPRTEALFWECFLGSICSFTSLYLPLGQAKPRRSVCLHPVIQQHPSRMFILHWSWERQGEFWCRTTAHQFYEASLWSLVASSSLCFSECTSKAPVGDSSGWSYNRWVCFFWMSSSNFSFRHWTVFLLGIFPFGIDMQIWEPGWDFT